MCACVLRKSLFCQKTMLQVGAGGEGGGRAYKASRCRLLKLRTHVARCSSLLRPELDQAT